MPLRESIEKAIYNGRLIAFAETVLDILTDHREWNADTTDEISTAAQNLGLATTQDHGYFVKTKP